MAAKGSPFGCKYLFGCTMDPFLAAFFFCCKGSQFSCKWSLLGCNGLFGFTVGPFLAAMVPFLAVRCTVFGCQGWENPYFGTRNTQGSKKGTLQPLSNLWRVTIPVYRTPTAQTPRTGTRVEKSEKTSSFFKVPIKAAVICENLHSM